MVGRIRNDVFVYAEGGGSGAGSAALQADFRQALSSFFEGTVLGSTRRPRVVACGGRDHAFDSFTTAIKQGKDALLLVDSEAAVSAVHATLPVSGFKPWAHLFGRDSWQRPAQASDDDCHLMTQCMESWFLADWATTKQFFGPGFKASALPTGPVEAVAKADVYAALDKASAKCKSKGPYGKGAHSFKLLALVKPSLIIKASPWAERFIDELARRKP